jgi:epidermal growth factor receptor substrate 15
MAIAFDTIQTAASNSGGASRVIDISSATDGAWVYCAIFLTDSSGRVFDALTGWDQLSTNDSDSNTCHYSVWRRQKQTGDSTFTITWTGGNSKDNTVWVSYTGLDNTTPNETIDVKIDLVSGATDSTDSVTPAAANRWALAIFEHRTTSNTAKNVIFSTASGMVERAEQNMSAAGNSPQTYVATAVDDSNGAVTQAAHSYSVNATLSGSPINSAMKIGILLYLIPSTTTWSVDSTLAVTATASPTATRVVSATASLGSTATLSPVPRATYNTSASATETATLAATAARAFLISASVSETATLTAVANRTFSLSSTATTTAALTPVANATFTVSSSLATTATLTATANRIFSVSAALSETATLAATALRTATIAALLAETATATPVPNAVWSVGASDTITANRTAVADVPAGAISIDATLTVTTNLTAVDQLAASCASTLAVTAGRAATAVRTATLGATLGATVTASPVPNAVWSVSSSDTITANRTAVADIPGGSIDIDATLAVTAGLTGVAQRVVSCASTLGAVAGASTTAVRAVTPSAVLSVSAARSATPSRTAVLGGTLVATATRLALSSGRFDIAASALIASAMFVEMGAPGAATLHGSDASSVKFQPDSARSGPAHSGDNRVDFSGGDSGVGI